MLLFSASQRRNERNGKARPLLRAKPLRKPVFFRLRRVDQSQNYALWVPREAGQYRVIRVTRAKITGGLTLYKPDLKPCLSQSSQRAQRRSKPLSRAKTQRRKEGQGPCWVRCAVMT
jgi:hypothetical protein